MFIFSCNQKEIELQNNLVGTWQLVTNNLNQEINEQTHSNFRELKTITNETFSVIDIIPKDSIFVGVFYGNYKITPKIYSETITYTNRNGVRMLNKVNKFNYKLENDTWTIEGIDNPYHQTWKKIKN